MVLCAWRSVAGCRRSSGRCSAAFPTPRRKPRVQKDVERLRLRRKSCSLQLQTWGMQTGFCARANGTARFQLRLDAVGSRWLLTAVTGICLRTQHCWISFAEKSIQSSVSHDTLGNDLGVRTVVVAGRVLKTMLRGAAMAAWEGAKEIYAA